MNEARYSRLTREFPDRAEALFARNEEEAKNRYEHLLSSLRCTTSNLGSQNKIKGALRQCRSAPFCLVGRVCLGFSLRRVIFCQ